MIRHTIDELKAPIDTYNVGYCASTAALIFQAATGRRYARPHAVFVLHAVSGEPAELRSRFTRYVERALRRRSRLPDVWFPLDATMRVFDAQEALAYGFVDAVIPERDP
jgi:ATP-dependent protease ClpP protease subunit